MNNKIAFQLDHVNFHYNRAKPLLRDCEMTVHRGDFFGIIGPNGAGKSTLFKLMTGLLKPTGGSIELLGQKLSQLSRRDIARKIAVVPQNENASFPFTVEELALMGRSPHLRGLLALESHDDRSAARESIETVGLAEFAHQRVDQLSGGERQLALIARALAQATDIMLLDEPTASLDLAHQQRILHILERRNRENRLTVVAVMHDLNLAARYCRKIAVLHQGRFIATGAPKDIINEQLLRQVYGVAVWTTQSPDGTPVAGVL